MNLRDYIKNLSPQERPDFAFRCKTSLGYLRKAISAQQTFHPKLCVRIERESGGLVTRRDDLHPDDWAEIWPELVESHPPPPAAPSRTDEASA